MPEYIGTAKANMAWIASREGNVEEADANACAALHLWRGLPLASPFQWTALWPLIGIGLARNRTDEAIEHARALLSPVEQVLPGPVGTAVEAAVRAWDAGDARAAWAQLEHAAQLARPLGYL